MKKIMITISEELAELVAKQQQDGGHPTFDETVTRLISAGLAVVRQREKFASYSNEELRALIRQAEESGPAEYCDGKSLREEVLRRYAEMKRSKR